MIISTEPRITEGTLKTSSGRPLPLASTTINGKVRGPMATVEVHQVFRNDTSEVLEATYLFPLSHNASVYHMEFRIGDRTVTAVIKEKEEARRTYEAAKSQGRAATLLEQERPNLFTLSVANIDMGAKIEVFLKYQELVTYDDGIWQFVFPLVAGDRYHSGESTARGTTAVPDGDRIRPPRARQKDRTSPVSISFDLADCGPIASPQSPSHSISVSPQSGGFHLHLKEGAVIPNRDFVLTWRAARSSPEAREVQLAPRIWFDREEGKPGTFCLYLPAPSVSKLTFTESLSSENTLLCGNCGAPIADGKAVQQIEGLGPAWKCEYCGVMHPVKPAEESTRLNGKNVMFLLDRSASTGNSDTAAEAVLKTLELLSEDDCFRIVAFHHELEVFGDLWTACTQGSIARATNFLADLKPRGGTEMDLALKQIAQLKGVDRPDVVVLITDGGVGNEGHFLKLVSEVCAETRLYVLGVGAAPNRYLLEKMAQMGRGACDVCTGLDTETISKFAGRVARAKPVLSELTLKWLEGMGMDLYPRSPLELFSGKSLCVVGRFVGDGPAQLELRGETDEGRPFVQVLPCHLPLSASTPGLSRIWASRRVDDLQDQLIKRPERLSEVRLEVLGLALQHSLVTPYTALVAADSEVTVDPSQPVRTVEVESPLPAAEPTSMIAGSARACLLGDIDEERPLMRSIGAEHRKSHISAAPAPAMDFMELESLAPEPEIPRSASGMMLMSSSPPAPSPPPAPKGEVESVFSPAALTRKVLGFRSRDRGATAPQNQNPVISEPDFTYSPEELERAREMVQGNLELVFLIDETGSMGPYIQQVQRRLLSLIRAVERSPLCNYLRLGLVTFRDHPPQDESFVTRVVPLTENIEEIREGVERMRANGGGDGPEAVTDGLMELLNLDWHPGSTRLVVMVGDAPPHGVEPRGDGFPDGCPCGRHWYTQAEGCREMNIVVHTVGCRGIRSFQGAEAVFQSVSKRTGGLYIPLENAALLIDLVSGLADRELDRRRLEGYVRELYSQHAEALDAAEPAEQVRFLTETLRSRNLRVLDFVKNSQKLNFRPVKSEDVAQAWDVVSRKTEAVPA